MAHEERFDPYRFRPTPSMTSVEAAEKAGVDLDIAKRLHRALGLPEVNDDEVDFDERDAETLTALKVLHESGIPIEELVGVARVYGQGFSRIADAESHLFRKYFIDPLREQGLDYRAIEERLEPVVMNQLEVLGAVLEYVHRRHLAVTLQQTTVEGSSAATAELSVSFVDLVDFTRIADDLPGSDLGALVDRFEQLVTEWPRTPEVRLVKMIGDAAMFVSPDAPAHLEVVRSIVEAVEGDDDLPQARAGMDAGEVVPLGGDYFGRPVNVAARIVGFARPGTTVISKGVADAVDPDTVRLSPIRAPSLKGVGRVKLFKVKDPESEGGRA